MCLHAVLCVNHPVVVSRCIICTGTQPSKLQWSEKVFGGLAVVNEIMNSAFYQNILKEKALPSVCDLKLKCTWVLQKMETLAQPSLESD